MSFKRQLDTKLPQDNPLYESEDDDKIEVEPEEEAQESLEDSDVEEVFFTRMDKSDASLKIIAMSEKKDKPILTFFVSDIESQNGSTNLSKTIINNNTTASGATRLQAAKAVFGKMANGNQCSYTFSLSQEGDTKAFTYIGSVNEDGKVTVKAGQAAKNNKITPLAALTCNDVETLTKLFTSVQLKQICKHFNVSPSGTKDKQIKKIVKVCTISQITELVKRIKHLLFFIQCQHGDITHQYYANDISYYKSKKEGVITGELYLSDKELCPICSKKSWVKIEKNELYNKLYNGAPSCLKRRS